MAYEQTPQDRDPRLWDIATKRAAFKRHVITYLIMNAFFWGLWFMLGGRTYSNGIPWPVWPTLGWGIGLGFHYFGAYGNHEYDAIEKEYTKLQNQKNKSI
jgi:hypothetical protein